MHRSLVMLLAVLLLGGCASATREIGQAAQRIDQHAEGIQTDLSAATDTGEVGPSAAPLVALAHGRAGAIRSESARVLDRLPQVEDRTSPWAKLLTLWAYVAIVAGVLGLLVYLGVGHIVRPFLQSVGWMIPKPTRVEAKLTAEAIAAGEVKSQAQVRAVEHRKATDPAFAVALKDAQSRVIAVNGAGRVGSSDVPKVHPTAQNAPQATHGAV